MWTAVWHALLCSLAGGALAALSGLAWQLVTGRTPDGELPTALFLFTAAWSGFVVGLLSAVHRSRLRRLQDQPAAAEKPPAPASPLPARRSGRPRNRLLARLSPDFAWEAISPALSRLLRRRPRALRGRRLVDLLHPDDHAVFLRALRQARDTSRVQTLSCRFVVPVATASQAYARTTFRTDTQLVAPVDPVSVRHVRLRVLPVGAVGDGPPHFICRFVDLTGSARHRQALARDELARARHEAERRHERLRRVSADLARLKESYRELYHNAPVMYFSLDVNGRLVTFNDTLIRTLGYRREELARQSYAELVGLQSSSPDGQRNPGEFRHAGAPFEGGEVETRWRKKDGGVLDVWVRTVAVLDEDGGFVRYRSAALDLTEKNRLANELRARGDELEGANLRLRAINSELEDFTYVVSHDLKEPLRTLQTYGHLLAEEYSVQLGADGFGYINHLIRASRRLGLLIDDLLNLSQAGRITRTSQPFDLFEAVATARQDLVDLIQRRQATVLTAGSLPRVLGDRQRITQLLTNLIANGLKYNQSPQPQVIIAAGIATDASGSDSPHEVVVSVSDNGIGIDPAYHEQVFGMFRRLHQPDEYEGSGAGLAICKKIVEGHGGRIWVESQLGRGATFFFTLPDMPVPSSAPGVRQLPPPASEGAAPRPRQPRVRAVVPSRQGDTRQGDTRGRVVLVEDDADAAHIIQRLGRTAGLAFTWFSTAEEAWAYLQEQQTDLMLFDVQLPGMSGVELCRRVRTRPALRDIPVALFVREQDPERLAPLRAAGADFFLSKDLLVNPALWQQRLQEILDESRQPLTS
jgi:PAS domain S-box-containing protein